ncbi:MAG: hypothetical protein U1F17_06235 [Burkholderiaceae bacterium]
MGTEAPSSPPNASRTTRCSARRTRWPGYYYRGDYLKLDDQNWHVLTALRRDLKTGERWRKRPAITWWATAAGSPATRVNIIEKTDEEIPALAVPLWRDSSSGTRTKASTASSPGTSPARWRAMDQVAAGHQFAHSELARHLSDRFDTLGIIRRGEHVTVLFRQRSTTKPGEWLGRLVPATRTATEDLRCLHLLTPLVTISSGSDVNQAIQAGQVRRADLQGRRQEVGHVLTRVEFPLGYVHGHTEILAPSVHAQLEGRSAGDVIEVAIDGNQIFGPRTNRWSSPIASRTSPRNTGRSAPRS